MSNTKKCLTNGESNKETAADSLIKLEIKKKVRSIQQKLKESISSKIRCEKDAKKLIDKNVIKKV
jgi:hypothetical protein